MPVALALEAWGPEHATDLLCLCGGRAEVDAAVSRGCPSCSRAGAWPRGTMCKS